MKEIKGFVTIQQYVNNTPDMISTLGELSTWSRTYSKEKGEYQLTTVPGYNLTTFKCIDTTTHADVYLDNDETSICLNIIKQCVVYATSNTIPYDKDDFKNVIFAKFQANVSNLLFGEFVSNGTIELPSWVSYTDKSNEFNSVKVWLSDAAFREQYEDYSISIIPPVDNLNSFHGSYGAAVTLLGTRTMDQWTSLIQQAKDDHPETFLLLMNFDYINPNNTSISNPSTWAVLIYGRNGNNQDAIKDALIEYILANSTATRNNWEKIFPDIFKRTEFVLLPRWDNAAIENLGTNAALYSSILNLKESINFAKSSISFYTDTHIEDKATFLPYDYKAIVSVCIPGESNLEGKTTLEEVFPDYIPVPSTSTDWNRMNIKTREWALFLEDLIITAETASRYSSIPTNMHKLIRNDILFISATYDNINYLVATKSNSIYDQE